MTTLFQTDREPRNHIPPFNHEHNAASPSRRFLLRQTNRSWPARSLHSDRTLARIGVGHKPSCHGPRMRATQLVSRGLVGGTRIRANIDEFASVRTGWT